MMTTMTGWRSNYWSVKIWVLRRSWFLIIGLLLLAVMVASVLLFSVVDEPSLLSGFRGNLVGEILGGVVFLLFGVHLGRKVERIIVERAEHEDRMRRMDRFIRFLEQERHYNVCFPELHSDVHPTGLVYRLEPVRPRGTALKRETEIDTSYVVRVVGPAYQEALEPEQLAEYERSQIKPGLYFCRFYNGEWHMGTRSFGRDWLEFHLYGKQGEMELSVTAQEFYSEAVRERAST